MSRILVIDADPGERLIVRSRVTDAGHEVCTADTGAKGLVEARASNFDLILLSADLGGGVDGAEVCRRLKSVPKLHPIPVVVYSNRAVSTEVTDRMYDAGCEAFVAKSHMPTLDRVIDVLLRIKVRGDELSDQNRMLERENRRLDEERQRQADMEASSSDAGSDNLLFRELAAGRPDGVLVVDGGGVVRHADIGACELLGSQLVGNSLGKIAPASGVEAFVRDARTSPREGFRFDVSARKDRSQRSLVASVVPVTTTSSEGGLALRVLLLLDLNRRRIAEEMLTAQEPGIPRQQLGSLMEAARATYTPDAIQGGSQLARSYARRLGTLAGEAGPILLAGERGSGRTLAARIVHYSSSSSGSFLQLRCSAMSGESLENELFGYAKGAFPGAVADRWGLLLMAQNGTLFLDEVGDLPLELQRRLVRALQESVVQRRGSTRPERVECRLIVSTSRDLKDLVAAGMFDKELYSLVSGRRIDVPALRDRPADVRELAAAFLERFGARHGVLEVSEEASWVLDQYDWPGNVAELEVCIEEACRRAEHGRIEVAHLTRPLRDLFDELPDRDLIPAVRPVAQMVATVPARVHGTHVSSSPFQVPDLSPWEITEEDPISLEHYEKKALLRALDCCNGDKLAAARLLKVGKSTLYRKLKKFGIT